MPMMNVHLVVWVSRLTDVNIELIGQAINNDPRSNYDEYKQEWVRTCHENSVTFLNGSYGDCAIIL